MVQGMDLVQLNQTLHDTLVNDRIIAQQMYGDTAVWLTALICRTVQWFL